MRGMLISGVLGLMLGMGAERLGLHRRRDVSLALGLMNPGLLRRLLLLVGAGAMLSALLMWLAVIDVDTLNVPPLNGGTLLGGAVFGAAFGYAGFAPFTAGAILGADRLLEGLCAVLGCLVGAVCLPYAEPLLAALRSWLDGVAATWFQVTLDKPYLLAGGFQGQACLGLMLTAVALCIRRREEPPTPQETPAVEEVSTDPQEVQEEAVVVSLPGEEVVVVDTAEDNEE